MVKVHKNRDSEKDAIRDRWTDQQSQGKSSCYFQRSAISNILLFDEHLVSNNRFIYALRLRTNTFEVREVVARTDPSAGTTCRQCRTYPETLGHVLGQCFAHKAKRIHRHNEIVDLVAEEYRRKRFTIMYEESFRVDGERLRPDLINETECKRYIVDVSVRYEDDGPLEAATREKVMKYSCLLNLYSRDKK